MSVQKTAVTPLGVPDGSAYLDAETLAWQATELPGFWTKKLYENPANGEFTILMKMDPGASCGAHAHAEFEQFYVLEGEIEDDHKVIKAGEYVCRAPGDEHMAKTKSGATLLLMYSRHL